MKLVHCVTDLCTLPLKQMCCVSVCRQVLAVKSVAKTDCLQVYLISTKAGSVGINLTAAFRMIIYDELWNPVHNAQVRTLNKCSRLPEQCVHHLLLWHDKTVILQLNQNLRKALNRKQVSPVLTHQWQPTDVTHSN